MTNQRYIYVYNIVFYVLGFLLFWEWLRPLEIVTDTANSLYFVIFTAFCFLLFFLRIPFWLSIPLRLVFLLYILHRIFFVGSFLDMNWLVSLYADLTINIDILLQSRWLEMSDLFRSFLFLLLLWVMSYLIHYWLIQAKTIFGFFVLTIIYLGVLDTFTRYDASEAIVRTMIFGLLMLSALQFYRIKENERIRVRLYWLLPLTIMIAFSVGIGFAAPKAAPQWPDPVPFLKSAAKEQINKNAIAKIGYGVDDTNLGGAFVNDETTVFIAELKKAHYWRIESKDFYTGKGWEVSENRPRMLVDNENIRLNIVENVDREKNITEKVTIVDAGDDPHVAYPVDLRAIDANQSVQLFVDPHTGKFFAEKDGQSVQVKSVEMTYDNPLYSVEALKLANEGDNAYIKELYTQLPAKLPERVATLAKEITANQATRYEKVKAVEAYFAKEGYRYETKKVAIPEVDEDYVDQFLFETKKGYCDNFSTSMIVLLRTLDIPARWVKGYTEGEYVQSLSDHLKLYEVKNANAHSWVEVYFPGIGWVPFEPTRGFSNPITFSEDALDIPTVAVETSDEQTKQVAEEKLKKEASEQMIEKKVSGGIAWFTGLTIPFKKAVVAASMLFIMIVITVKFKKRWYPYWLLLRYRLRKDSDKPDQAFEMLFQLLKNKGLYLQNGETIREFAARVDEHLQTGNDMKNIVGVYEVSLYSDSLVSEEDMDRIRKLWENLVKKILS